MIIKKGYLLSLVSTKKNLTFTILPSRKGVFRRENPSFRGLQLKLVANLGITAPLVTHDADK